MKQKVLFIDRDGTLIREPQDTFQVNGLEQLELLPAVIHTLRRLSLMGYRLVMVSNQDGLGTVANPMANFQLVQSRLLQLLAGEGVVFDAIHIDDSYEWEQKSTRKPGTGMLQHYFTEAYDLAQSFVIGDRLSDVALAANMGCQAILIRNNEAAADSSCPVALVCTGWEEIGHFLLCRQRIVRQRRITHETDIALELNPDGSGIADISTGIGFLDHMLEQLARHGGFDLFLKVRGDLQVDEHHSIEDTALVIGAALAQVMADKRGTERYGYCLPMDDCLANVALDFGGRPWLVWNVNFRRAFLGAMPTEMCFHFFKSFSDAAQCNLHITATGSNDHHKAESIFKAWARALKQALRKDYTNLQLPSTKGLL